MRLRLTFAKLGALRYTGHLDLHNLLERAARRAGLPLAYSQGFHPQPKINIASALPLGFSSRAEVMDIWLTTDCEGSGLRTDLQAALPTGIQILTAEQVDDRAPALQTQVVSAEYEATLSEDTAASDLSARLSAVMEAESLPRERRGKPYDLRPLIEELALTPNPSPKWRGEQKIFMRLAAREGATGRPEEVLAELGIPVESTRVERTRLIFLG
jgi:radical SAM-linked protein